MMGHPLFARAGKHIASGTKHLGVRHPDHGSGGEGKGWEVYDRETGSRIGPPHATKYEAEQYAQERQRTTYGD